MKFQIWALGLAALSSGVSGCAYSWDHTNCQWFGNSPACGEVKNNIGDRDKDGWVLVDWTKDVGIDEKIGMGDCGGNAYGNTCWSGYKRLWCKSSKYHDSNPFTDGELGHPGITSDLDHRNLRTPCGISVFGIPMPRRGRSVGSSADGTDPIGNPLHLKEIPP